MGKRFWVLRGSDDTRRRTSRRPVTLPAGMLTMAAVGFLALGFSITPAFAGPLVSQEESDPHNEDLEFEQIHVQVWPEYDSPKLLVLSEFVLAEGTDLPVEFSMALPKGARVHALGQVDEQGQYLSAPNPPELDRSQADWDIARLSFSDFPRLRLEYYYDPGLDLSGLREFELLYELPAAAQQASLVIQEPTRATGFRVDPELANVVDDPSGFTYHVEQTFGAAAGSRYSVTVSYSKPDAEPSVDPATAAGQSNDEHAEGGRSPSVLIAMGAVLVASLGSIGIGLRQRKKNAPLICTRCNADGLEAGDAFCIRCGAPRGEADEPRGP